MFFSFDGLDGVGKSTQITRFCDWLRAAGHDVVSCRDPGSTPIGDAIREILLGHRDSDMTATTEMLLYMAARAQMVSELIRPALDRGQTVVADRYLLANIVYQGHATELGPEAVRAVGQLATGGLMPDLVFLLDMPQAAALGRLDRPLDRIEGRGHEYREQLRRGYLHEANADPDHIAVIDAAGSIAAVQEAIRAAALQAMGRADRGR